MLLPTDLVDRTRLSQTSAYKYLQTNTNVYEPTCSMLRLYLRENFENNMEQVLGYKALTVYQKSFSFTLSIFYLTKKFPREEQFGLTSQLRRSSRSVCANLVEGYRKRMYPKLFYNKLTISDGEAAETLFWLEVALSCEYITIEEFERHEFLIIEIGKMLGAMMKAPEKFAVRK